MDIRIVFSAIGMSLGYLIITFPIAVILVRVLRFEKLPLLKLFPLLGFCVVFLTPINLFRIVIDDSVNLTNWEFLLSFLIPLLIPLIILSLYWRPKPPITQALPAKVNPTSLQAPEVADTVTIVPTKVNRNPPTPSRLNTPGKRLWFLVFVFGLVLAVVTYAVFEIKYTRDFWDAIFSTYTRYTSYRYAMAISVSAIVSGLLMSYLYDHTIGLLIKWVNGSSAST